MSKLVSFSTAGLNKALKGIEEKVTRVSLDLMEEVIQEYIPDMQESFDNAEYDGEFNVKVGNPIKTSRSVRVEIKGSALKYIEYGTGVHSIAKGSKQLEGWVFRARGRNITLNAGGKPARYKRPAFTRYYYEGPRSHKRHYVDPFGRVGLENSNIDWNYRGEDPKPVAVYGKGSGLFDDDALNDRRGIKRTEQHRQVSRFEIQSEVVPERDDPRRGYYFTHGNPPNYIIADNKDWIYQDIYKRLKARFK